MKEKVLYTCEICHTDWSSKEKAINCEKSHREIKEITNKKFRASENYPDWVEIKFTDGHIIKYKR